MSYVRSTKEFSIHDWYDKKVSSCNIIIAYHGIITSEIITDLLSKIENKLDQLELNPKGVKLIYNVMVEVLQNLYHHSLPDIFDADGSPEKWAAFILFSGEGKVSLSTGNFIEKKDIKALKGKIDYINSLSREEIKEYYVKILNNSQYSEKGGGGLGLIDVARKTGSKYVYSFFDINDDYSFYNLNINIL